jgi:hypothetical protein
MGRHCRLRTATRVLTEPIRTRPVLTELASLSLAVVRSAALVAAWLAAEGALPGSLVSETVSPAPNEQHATVVADKLDLALLHLDGVHVAETLSASRLAGVSTPIEQAQGGLMCKRMRLAVPLALASSAWLRAGGRLADRQGRGVLFHPSTLPVTLHHVTLRSEIASGTTTSPPTRQKAKKPAWPVGRRLAPRTRLS